MGVQERQLQRFATMAAEVTACGGVSAYILRPDTPGWFCAIITNTAHGAACFCCKQQPCDPVMIVSVQAAEGATLTLPMPVCADCCKLQQVLAGLDCVCADLFPHPVRLQMYGYEGGQAMKR